MMTACDCMYVRTYVHTQGLASQQCTVLVLSSSRHSTHLPYCFRNSLRVRGVDLLRCGTSAALTACRRTGMIRHRCIKLFIFHTKINYRFYSHSIKKHGICVWLKQNSAEFFIKPNIGTRIGKDSQILPIPMFYRYCQKSARSDVRSDHRLILILPVHKWMRSRPFLCCAVRAVLCCAVLCCAVLCCAVLCCAVLCCAVLY